MDFEKHRGRVEDIVDYCCESVQSSKEGKEIIKEVEKLYNKVDKTCQTTATSLSLPFTGHPEEPPAPKRHRPSIPRVRAAQTFNDSIHHTIEVNSLEKEIINTPEFFRLNDIKQLGGKFHVYCGATHTRFQHSIGVCYLAAEFIDHLKKQENDRKMPEELQISQEEEYCVRIAGLCHDLGHGPFSHLFEGVIKDVCLELKDSKHLHERLSKLMFKKLLVDNPKVLMMFAVHYGLTAEHVKDIEAMIVPDKDYKKDEKKKFLYEIVANKESGMDVDKWDYFARDFLHLGVTNEFDWRRCMKMSSVVRVGDEYHIGFRDKEITNIYGMFRTRSILYLKALMHNTVHGIEYMLEDILCGVADVKMFAIPKCDNSKESELMSLKKAVQAAELHKSSASEKADLRGYMALTDSILHFIMYAQPCCGVSEAQKMIKRLQRRELYKCVAEKTIPCEDYDKIDQETLKEKMKKYSSEGKWGIKLVCLKFASEESLDPIKDIYLFLKPEEASIPMGSKVGESGGRIKDASPLCKPEKLFEYRLRMFRKSGDEDLKGELETCYQEIKSLFSE